jgi:hypothetical protein
MRKQPGWSFSILMVHDLKDREKNQEARDVVFCIIQHVDWQALFHKRRTTNSYIHGHYMDKSTKLSDVAITCPS